MLTKPLSELFRRHGSDKATNPDAAPGGTGHAYGTVYDELLAARRDSLAAVLEVGVLGGASIRAWREWLPEACRVVGIDNNLTCGAIAGADLYSVDSRDADALQAVLGDATFDLVVDDGGHGLWEQQPTWAALYPRVRPGGLYLIEDIQHPDGRDWFARLGATVYDQAPRTGRFDDCIAVFVKGGV